MTEADWLEFKKLVELVQAHKVRSLETKIGTSKVHIYYKGITTYIELAEVKHGA